MSILVRIAGTASRGVICVMLQTVYSNRHCSVQHRKSEKLGTMIYTLLQHLNLMGPPMLCDRVLHLESAGHEGPLDKKLLVSLPWSSTTHVSRHMVPRDSTSSAGNGHAWANRGQSQEGQAFSVEKMISLIRGGQGKEGWAVISRGG